MRIVADTNVVVSAFLWGGPPRALLTAARQGSAMLYPSAALIAELEAMLARAKFAERLARVRSSPEEIVGDYLALAQLVRPTSTPRVVPDDPDDDHVIACALTAHADLIVSGASALRAIREYAAIRIVSPAEALILLPRS